jgi:hypothetical protein
MSDFTHSQMQDFSKSYITSTELAGQIRRMLEILDACTYFSTVCTLTFICAVRALRHFSLCKGACVCLKARTWWMVAQLKAPFGTLAGPTLAPLSILCTCIYVYIYPLHLHMCLPYVFT